jgi:hypothetical protein
VNTSRLLAVALALAGLIGWRAVRDLLAAIPDSNDDFEAMTSARERLSAPRGRLRIASRRDTTPHVLKLAQPSALD